MIVLGFVISNFSNIKIWILSVWKCLKKIINQSNSPDEFIIALCYCCIQKAILSTHIILPLCPQGFSWQAVWHRAEELKAVVLLLCTCVPLQSDLTSNHVISQVAVCLQMYFRPLTSWPSNPASLNNNAFWLSEGNKCFFNVRGQRLIILRVAWVKILVWTKHMWCIPSFSLRGCYLQSSEGKVWRSSLKESFEFLQFTSSRYCVHLVQTF